MRTFVMLALLAACTRSSTADPSVDVCSPNGGRGLSGICVGRTLRIATYNMNFGLAGDPDGVAAIDGLAADVVLLQETNDVWAAAIHRGLGFPHHRFGAPRSWPAGGLGVLSRFPIVALDELPANAGPFFAWRIVIQTDAGRVQLLDVHLRPPMSDGGSWVVGYFTTRPVRVAEIREHLAALDPALPTIVAGDFNETLSGGALDVVRDHGFRDAVNRPGEPTWHWPVGSLELRLDLDHILVDHRFRARASGIAHTGRSDHWPVWADVSLK